MTRLIFAVFCLVLVSGPAFGHGLGHHGHGGAPEPVVTYVADPGDEAPEPAHHRHDEPGSFHHCAVSASCAPLFLFSGGGALPRIGPIRAGWRIAADAARRSPVLERDPPVPRA